MDHGQALRLAFLRRQARRSKAARVVGWLGSAYRACRSPRKPDPLAGLEVGLVDKDGLPCLAFRIGASVRSAPRP